MFAPVSSPTHSPSSSFSSSSSSDSAHAWSAPSPLDSVDLRRYSAGVHAFTTQMWLDSPAEIERESQKKASKVPGPAKRSFVRW